METVAAYLNYRMSFLLVLIALFVPFNVSAQEGHRHERHSHPEYARIKNPVPMTAQSIAEGGKLYVKHCIACHGEGGKGGVNDLAAPVLIHGNSDGEIFHAITNGITGTSMSGFENALSKEARWHLVNYIRSLGEKIEK